jgi:hypothetical protein
VELARGNYSSEHARACDIAGAGLLRQAVCDEAEHVGASLEREISWCNEGTVRIALSGRG